VSGDHVPPAGAVGAGGALVRLLACVGALVGGEVVRPAEHLAAHPAGVGLDAGVEPHVPGQHVAPREAPLAHVAEVGLAGGLDGFRFMSARHVLRQPVVQREHLAADRTHVRQILAGLRGGRGRGHARAARGLRAVRLRRRLRAHPAVVGHLRRGRLSRGSALSRLAGALRWPRVSERASTSGEV